MFRIIGLTRIIGWALLIAPFPTANLHNEKGSIAGAKSELQTTPGFLPRIFRVVAKLVAFLFCSAGGDWIPVKLQIFLFCRRTTFEANFRKF